MLLITATANKSARTELKKKCVMQNCVEIIDNPDRTNIKLFVKKVKSTELIADLFYPLIKSLVELKQNCEKHLVFCCSIKTCGDIYSAFRMQNVPEECMSMFHSKTIDSIKEKRKGDMQNEAGKIRVLIATSAAGMGVNFKNVNNVIHFGPPKDMDSLVQQLGRAGRDGHSAKAMMLFNAKQCRNVDADIVKYIKNADVCRREVMLSAYNNEPDKKRVYHLCCDICTSKCPCDDTDCKDFDHFFNAVEEEPDFSSVSASDSETSDIDSDF